MIATITRDAGHSPDFLDAVRALPVLHSAVLSSVAVMVGLAVILSAYDRGIARAIPQSERFDGGSNLLGRRHVDGSGGYHGTDTDGRDSRLKQCAKPPFVARRDAFPRRGSPDAVVCRTEDVRNWRRRRSPTKELFWDVVGSQVPVQRSHVRELKSCLYWLTVRQSIHFIRDNLRRSEEIVLSTSNFEEMRDHCTVEPTRRGGCHAVGVGHLAYIEALVTVTSCWEDTPLPTGKRCSRSGCIQLPSDFVPFDRVLAEGEQPALTIELLDSLEEHDRDQGVRTFQEWSRNSSAPTGSASTTQPITGDMHLVSGRSHAVRPGWSTCGQRPGMIVRRPVGTLFDKRCPTIHTAFRDAAELTDFDTELTDRQNGAVGVRSNERRSGSPITILGACVTHVAREHPPSSEFVLVEQGRRDRCPCSFVTLSVGYDQVMELVHIDRGANACSFVYPPCHSEN